MEREVRERMDGMLAALEAMLPGRGVAVLVYEGEPPRVTWACGNADRAALAAAMREFIARDRPEPD